MSIRFVFSSCEALPTLIRFQTKMELFCSVFKRICVHSYRFRIVFARPHYNAVSVLKTLYTLSTQAQNELDACDACAFQYIGRPNWREIGSVCPPFWILTVEWSGAQSCLFWWRHRFQIASFSPSTLVNSVFKKHRSQIAPLRRAFSNGSGFGDRFWRCSVDDSRIRSKNSSVFVWKRISVDWAWVTNMLREVPMRMFSSLTARRNVLREPK